MNLVIKLDEETYGETINRTEWDTLSLGLKLIEAVQNGTPLPKGHGDLIDIQPLMRGLYEETCVGELTYTTSEVYKMLEEECPVIIEADKE